MRPFRPLSLSLSLSLFLYLSLACATATVLHAVPPAGAAPPPELATLRPEHPRLLATSADWTRLSARLAAEPDLAAYHAALLADAERLLTAKPSTYQKTGRRLLSVSRTLVQRVLLLAYAARTTDDDRYVRRAETEMLAATAFPDWNPSHFLDVGEATAALALGYDWLFERLTPDARATIRAALVKHGLQPGLAVIATGKGWPKAKNNWNQVCLGGLTLGALALADDEPELAAQLLAATRANIVHGLAPYAPDGVYPEGPSYWAYGTSYQVLLNAALESALGTDWNLAAVPGFLASAGAYLQTTAPSGRAFNFADGGETVGFEPAVFWFARKLSNPGLLRFERDRLATSPNLGVAIRGNRFAPLAALWWPPAGTADAAPTLPILWTGQGENPITVARSSWTDPRAFYLALKGGAAELNHAHMDAGSFVLEADGVRWAIDLGAQSYESLESKGVDLWNRRQNSHRWAVYRLNNFSHNTLTIDRLLHRVDGHAKLRGFNAATPDTPATVDLTPVFAGQANHVERHFEILPGHQTLITDHLRGLAPGVSVRWQMATRADVSLDGNRATLTQEGRTFTITALAPDAVSLQVEPAAPPANDFNVKNPGVSLVYFTATAPADGTLELRVNLSPGASTTVTSK